MTTMPTLDPIQLGLHGRFQVPTAWMKGRPGPVESVRGDLTFDEPNGAVLKLHGSLSPRGALAGSPFVPTIFGSDSYAFYVLYGCRKILMSGSDPQYAREHYAAEEVLIFEPPQDIDWREDPRAFEQTESLRAAGFTLKSKLHRQHWVGASGISYEKRNKSSLVRFDPAEPLRSSMEGIHAKLAISHDNNSVNSRFGVLLEQAALIRIRWQVPRPVSGHNSAVHTISMLHGLVSLCMHEPVRVEHVLLRFDRAESTPLVARLYKQWSENSTVSTTNAPVYPTIALADIGGLDGVVRWIHCCDRYWLPALLLANRWRSPSAYVETKFNDVYVALESFARIKAGMSSGKGIGTMANVLRILARDWGFSGTGVRADLQEELGDNDSFHRFRKTIGNVEAWSKAMARARSQIVIHPGMERPTESRRTELYSLFETGYVLAVLCLFSEAGIPPAAGLALCEALSAADVVKEPMFA